jgi:hypothetical protein
MRIAFGCFDPLPAYEALRPVFRLFTEAMGETSHQGWDQAKLEAYQQAAATLYLALTWADGRPLATNGIQITGWSSLGWTVECELEAQVLDDAFWVAWRRARDEQSEQRDGHSHNRDAQ